MFAAIDNNGNKVFANSDKTFNRCKCLECGGEVIHKAKGNMSVPHFAHKSTANCFYGIDKDFKCEWHRRMQEIFPKDACEVRFEETDTDEIRIADVYLKETNTVIEFQNSPIDCEEFERRTMFHVNHGRHVAWIFYEKGKNVDSKYGKFRILEGYTTLGDPCHGDCHFQWIYSRRKTLEFAPFLNIPGSLQSEKYSICVDYGEDNIVHRIISSDEEYREVCFSVHPISLSSNMDGTEFFKSEEYWLSFSPWKEKVECSKAKLAQMKQERNLLEKQQMNQLLNRLGF